MTMETALRAPAALPTVLPGMDEATSWLAQASAPPPSRQGKRRSETRRGRDDVDEEPNGCARRGVDRWKHELLREKRKRDSRFRANPRDIWSRKHVRRCGSRRIVKSGVAITHSLHGAARRIRLTYPASSRSGRGDGRALRPGILLLDETRYRFIARTWDGGTTTCRCGQWTKGYIYPHGAVDWQLDNSQCRITPQLTYSSGVAVMLHSRVPSIRRREQI